MAAFQLIQFFYSTHFIVYDNGWHTVTVNGLIGHELLPIEMDVVHKFLKRTLDLGSFFQLTFRCEARH